MSHAYVRDANVVGALAVGLADRIQAAAVRAGGQGASAPAALVALHGMAGGATIDALARILGLTHSGAVRLVDRLSAGRLVERRGGADQRSVSLRLTPEGRRTARRVLAQREAAVEAALAGLAPADRAAIVRVTERVLANLLDDPVDEARICRLCDVEACGRPGGECPVQRASAAAFAAPAGPSEPEEVN